MPHNEDQAAAALHVVGLILTGVMGARLWALAGRTGASPVQQRSVLVFIAAWFVLYTASVAFHLAPTGTLRQLLMAFDQGAIFILIAAGWAPLAPFRMAPGKGSVLLLILWSLAVLGILVELVAAFSTRHDLLHGIGFGMYLLQATVPLVLHGRAMLRRLSHASLWFLIGSMAIYSIGLVFYRQTDWAWNHVVWHFAIVLGCMVNFIGVGQFLREDDASRHWPPSSR